MTIVYIQFGPRPERKRKQALEIRSSRMASLGFGILTFATAGIFVFGADLVAHSVTGYVGQAVEQLYLRGARVP